MGGFFPFPGTALPGQFPDLRSRTCKHPHARPGPAALRMPGGLEASRSPSEPEAAGRPPSGRPKSGAMGLVSSRAGRTALPGGGPSKVWGEGTGRTQGASCPEVPLGAFPSSPPSTQSPRSRAAAGRMHTPPPLPTPPAPRPEELCKASPPASCPRRPGCQTPGEASGLLCFSGKWWRLRRAQESA